ncbi:aminoacyl-tRNA deacylase [Cohnella sp. WQ 127256]|uniref:aminoacyl-tRNA deacylase n=1 Tax=Cohnella sp. WQ 127256 TaxID=2938790 RepID=UPI002119A586|nr:YbaK/EbsC family protein [Cohnella sp. WQ 127256]
MSDVVTLLEELKIDYEFINHEITIKSAQEGADYFGIEIGQTAPTLILKSGMDYYAMIISGDYGKIDFEMLKEILKIDEIRLAKPKEVEQITGCVVGSVALIGHGLPTIMDRQMNRYTYIYGGTGKINSTLKINVSDVERLNDVIAYVR